MANLGVAEIVPVTDGVVRNIVEQAAKFSFGWKRFDADSVLDTQRNSCCFRVGQGRLQPFKDTIIDSNCLTVPDGVQFEPDVPTIEISAVQNRANQPLGVVWSCHRAKVHHHPLDAQPVRIVNGLEGIPPGAVSFVCA